MKDGLFQKGDRVALHLDKVWNATVVKDQTSVFVTVRLDDYKYTHPYADGNGHCHTYEAANFTLLASASQSVSANDPPINDHVCTTCNNNRCSKTERSCWKCGEPIKV